MDVLYVLHHGLQRESHIAMAVGTSVKSLLTFTYVTAVYDANRGAQLTSSQEKDTQQFALQMGRLARRSTLAPYPG